MDRKSVAWVILVAGLVASAVAQSDSDVQEYLELVTDSEKVEFLRDEASDYLTPHNNARRATGANIPNLVWKNDLAQYATNWARNQASSQNDCQLRHNPEGKYGENIYWSSWQSNPGDAVSSWVSEQSDYDYNSNSCASDKVCGHYTQVVWRNSKRVGCGSATCPGGGKFVVCNYDPPGNWVGEWPY